MSTAPTPAEGQTAPDFTLPASGGVTVTLSALRGKWVVLFAYGKDGTPTCTNEIRDFQARLAEFHALGAEVLGVSKDKPATHDRFAAKEAVTMPLLSDAGGRMMEDWGIYGEKIFFGKPAIGVLRKTFLIDPQGGVARVWVVDKVKDHAAEVLAALKACAG